MVVNAPVNYTVYMSVRLHGKVCITHNSETGCTIEFKLPQICCLGYEDAHIPPYFHRSEFNTYRLMALDELKKTIFSLYHV